MSPFITQYIKDGKPAPAHLFLGGMLDSFPNQDKHRNADGLHRVLATNIYKTKDGKFYHTHGEAVLLGRAH